MLVLSILACLSWITGYSETGNFFYFLLIASFAFVTTATSESKGTQC